VIGLGFGDGDEQLEFQGEGGANGLSATQADMTPPHALDHIRQSVNGSTERTARAGTGYTVDSLLQGDQLRGPDPGP